MSLNNKKAPARDFMEKFKLIFDNSPFGKYFVGPGDCLDVNDAFCKMLGYTKVEINGITLEKLIHPDDRRLYKNFEKALSEKAQNNTDFELRYIRKNGEIIWGNVTMTAHKDANGKLLYFFISILDITSRKEYEKKLTASEERFKKLFENANTCIVVYSTPDNGKKFVFKAINPAACKVDNLNPEDIFNKDVTTIFPGIKEFGLLDVLRRVWYTGVSEHFPAKLYKDKRIQGWRDNFIYKLPSGELVATYNDITEKKKSEKLLIEKNSVLSKIKDFSFSLLSVKTSEELEENIVNILKNYLDSPLVTFSSIQDDTVILKRFITTSNVIKSFTKLTGINPYKFSVKLPDSDFQEMIERPVNIKKSFTEVSGGSIPEAISAIFMKIVGANRIYALAYVYEGRAFGTSLIALKKDSPEPSYDFLHSFSSFVALSLQRFETEETLKTQTDLYKIIADKMTDVVWLMDLQGKSLFVSPSIKSFTGFSVEEYLAQTIESRFTKESSTFGLKFFREEIAKYTQNTLQLENYSARIEMEYICKNGGTKWGELIVTPYFDSIGKMSGIHGVTRDITQKKEVERSLLKTTNIIKNSPMIVFRWKNAPGWPVEHVTENISQLEYSANDFTSGVIPYASIVHPDDLARVADEVQSHIKNKSDSFIQSYRVYTKSGDVRWIEDHTITEKDDSGEIISFEGVIFDITEAKTAQENKNLYVTILELLRDITVENDVVQKILNVTKSYLNVDAIGLRYSPDAYNLKFSNMIGFTDKFIKKESIIITKLEEKSSFNCFCEYVLLCGEKRDFLTDYGSFYTNDLADFVNKQMQDAGNKIKFKNNCLEENFKSIALIPLYDERGQKVGIFQLHHKSKNFFTESLIKTIESISKSISIALGKKEIINQIYISEKKYKDLVENINDIIYTIDNDTRIEFLTPTIKKYFDFEVNDLIGKSFIEFAHPDDVEYLKNKFVGVINGIVEPSEFRLRNKAGEYKWCRSSSRPLYKNGSMVGISGVLTIIDDRIEKEDQIKKLNKEIEQIIYVTSHDLRSPLVNIHGFSNEIRKILNRQIEEIQNKTDLDSIRKLMNEDYKIINESFNYIFPSITKINNLIDGLLSLSRIGRTEVSISDVDMDLLFREIISVHEYSIKQNEVTINISPLHSCKSDKKLLNQLFSNLIENAIKYKSTQRPPEIKIYSSTNENSVLYHVEDNGIGIQGNELERIFELFYRLDRSAKGEGIGLSLVKKIADKLNGTISVESEYKAGSRFILTLGKTPEK